MQSPNILNSRIHFQKFDFEDKMIAHGRYMTLDYEDFADAIRKYFFEEYFVP